MCAYCPKLCSHVCPVSGSTKRETHTPWGKQTILYEIDRGLVPLGAEYVEPLFACMECGACTEACDHEVDVAATLRAGRALAFERGLLPDPLRRMLGDRPGIEAGASRAAHAAAGPIVREPGARNLFMPGCAACASPDLVVAAWRIVREIRGDSCAVFQEACCGLPYLQAGDVAGFRESARSLAAAAAGSRSLVVLDPGCAWTLRRLLPEHGIDLDPEVTTLVELVLPHLGRFVRRSSPEGPVFYHDPCRLGRGLGLYDPPREILLRLVPGGARDLHRARESGPCCGGGGAVPLSMPVVSRDAAGRLAARLAEEGARTVVTACPTCHAVLSAQPGLSVVDITELLARSI